MLFINNITISAQQEAMYSQYMFNLLNINPAYAGNQTVHNITLLYRNQWIGVEGAPKTSTLSWDYRKSNTNVGYGLQVGSDKLGVENSTFVKGYYSYRLPLKNASLSFGMDVGALNYQANYASISSTDSDPLFSDDINRFMPKVGLGCLYESDRFYVGFSVPDILDTKVSNTDDQVNFIPAPHYFLNGGLLLNAGETVKIKPSVLIKAVSGAPLEFDLNLNTWLNKSIGFGASYRTNDAIVGMLELQLFSSLRLGYAFDYTISQLKNYNNKGTHEIMLRFEFNNGNNSNVLSPRYY